MGVQTPNGFTLDNSGKRVVVDPVEAVWTGVATLCRAEGPPR